MRRPSSYDPEPEESEPTFLERVRAAAASLVDRLQGEHSQQAMPMSNYRGQPAPVVPYHERQQQFRSRRRQSAPTTLVVVLVALVLIVLLFYLLSWALGGLFSAGGRGPATPAANSAAVDTVGTPGVIPTAASLPPAAPGGTQPSPSPSPGGRLAPGPGTPDANSGERTYIVKPGDFPGLIAREFNVPVDALLKANNISDPRSLKPGDKLVIPTPPVPTPGA
jgi:LysM repeat protein